MMSQRPVLLAFDMEGVITPEIWIAVAEHTGIPKLRLTTRDIPDYDQLMRGRLALLREHGLKLRDIQQVISTLAPLPGATEFVRKIRQRHPFIILSDTYYEFAAPLLKQLDWPVLFCNSLETDADNNVVNYHLRQRDGKKQAAIHFKQLNFRVLAVGDSYNDTAMLAEADQGILFRPSEKVRTAFPQFPVVSEYTALEEHITAFAAR